MTMLLWIAYGLCFGAVAIAGVGFSPAISHRLETYTRRRASETSQQLGEMFVELTPQNVWLMYLLAPIGLSALGWMLTGKWFVAAAGLPLGLLVPRFVVAQMARARKATFYNQLVDGLLVLSSSLKAGLSMMQAFTVLTEEMPPPISQEFSLLLKETRMGVSVEEALEHLKARMPSDDVALFVTAVLVARETGGDVTRIFGRLVETMRERKKVKERVKTLTFMARLQGLIMGALPFLFGYFVYRMNPQHFTFFLVDPMGQLTGMVIATLMLFSTTLFLRFARSPL